MAKNILWLYGLHEESGYARNSRDFIKSLNLQGLNVKFPSLGYDSYPEKETMKQFEAGEDFEPEVRIHNVVPSCFLKTNEDKIQDFLMTFAETDRIPDEWIEPCNKADGILTQSYFSQAAFMFSGVKSPTMVACTPTDTDLIRKTIAKTTAKKQDGKFTFFANGEWTPRKGWDILLEAFYRTFHKYDFANLLIKTCSMTGVETKDSIVNSIRSFKNRYPGAKCQITLVADILPIEAVWAMYKTADCFVLPSRGEAGGIPYMEAMALGIPVIVPCKGGQIDYINDDIALQVKAKYAQASRMPHNRFYNENMYWIETDIDDLGDKMMSAVTNYDTERFEKGSKRFEEDFGFNGNNIKEFANFLRRL